MIPQGVQVFVALEPVDLRYSFDRLSGLAKERSPVATLLARFPLISTALVPLSRPVRTWPIVRPLCGY
jgi:hypothetical protein